MSNLVPTPRTDKNGRTVIRHMKPDYTTRDRQSIPALGTKHVVRTHDQLIMDAQNSLAEALRAGYAEKVVQPAIQTMKPNLEGYSENTLTRIKTHPWTYKSARIVIMRSSKIDNDLSRWDEGTINDFMAVAVETGIIDDDSVSSLHVDSWHLYDGLHPTNNNADYNEERLNQLVAIHRVVEHMEADGRSPFLYRANTTQLESYYLEDHYLRELLLNPEENYSRVDIVDIITTHSVYDAGRIKAMLDSTSPALRSGVI